MAYGNIHEVPFPNPAAGWKASTLVQLLFAHIRHGGALLVNSIIPAERRVECELERLLQSSGGKLTDALEREAERNLLNRWRQ